MNKRTKLYPFISIVIVLAALALVFIFFDPNESEVRTNEEYQVQNFLVENSFQLEKDMLNEGFSASENFIAWLEYYSKSLYYIDLRDNNLKSIPLMEGNGPNEYESLLGLTSVNDIAYLLSAGNMKLIRYDLEKGQYLEDIPLSKPVISITNHETEINSVNIGGGNGSFPLFSSIDPHTGVVNSVENSSIDSNPLLDSFKFAARYYSNSDFLLRVSLYTPSIMLFDRSLNLMTEFYYDQVELPLSDGMNPNMDLKMRTIDAALYPDSNILYLVQEGKTENKELSRSNIYSLDLNEKAYTFNVIETPINSIKEIFMNRKYLYLYDDKEFKIYWMKIN